MEKAKQALLKVTSLLGCLGLLLAGTIALVRLLPAEWLQRLSRLPGSMMRRMFDNMPDD